VTVVLCPLAALDDTGAKGITLEGPDGRREIFVVRRLGHVFAYENACPHIGTPLDFMPDRFLTGDGRHLLCSTHGALFEIASGLCIHGPCRGESLTPVPVAVRDGQVVLTAR
jgi:nitrite reductase/ring-hydroxylating ferredoxin subunit